MTSANTLNRVERACTQLHHDGQQVTFTAVAAATDMGRATPYRNPVDRPGFCRGCVVPELTWG
jgi:hypothetical protein